MQAGIKCIGVIATKTGLCVQLLNQWYDGWMQYLQAISKQMELPPKQARIVLFCVGILMRFYSFDGAILSKALIPLTLLTL